MFSDFFENKIENLIVGFVDEALFDLHPVVNQQNKLTCFNTVTLSNIRSIVGRVKRTYTAGVILSQFLMLLSVPILIISYKFI